MDLLQSRQGSLKSPRDLSDLKVYSASHFLVLGSLTFLAALLSLYLSRGSVGFGIIWLPNALMIGIFWASKQRNLPAHVLMLSLGVSAANLAYGDPLLLAAFLGIANGVEFLLVAVAIERVLGFQSPLESHGHYLKFLLAVCILPPVLAATLLATVVTEVVGGSWREIYVIWMLGDLVSILAFTPFFYLATRALMGRASLSKTESLKFLGCVAVLFLCLLLPLFTTAQAGHFVFATPLLAVFAIWLRVETVNCIAAVFLMSLGVLVFFDRTLFETSVGFGDSELLFVSAFGGMVVTGSLIASVVHNLKSAESSARDGSRLKSEFLATMSHEIRTPLNAIMGMFQLIERSDVADRQKRQAATGYKASANLLRLLSDILEMSRLEACAVELWTRECALKTLTSEWQVMAEGLIKESKKQIDFSLDLQGNSNDTIWVDDSRLGQVVHNLMDNAVRFSEQGKISILVKQVAGLDESAFKTLEISISDTGCGIAKDQQQVIFDRFRQTGGSIKRKVGGAGLGLAISRDLIRLMDGALSVESELGLGTTFKVSIPQNAFGR